MGVLFELFLTFLKIGFLSFGGGYALIPVIEHEVTAHGWIDAERFAETVAVAGMSPGPVAVNSAILAGYEAAGFPGAVVGTAGMTLPSFLVVLLIGAFFFRLRDNRYVLAAFYGLRPVVTGLIVYAAYRFMKVNGSLDAFSHHTLFTLVIAGLSLIAMLRYKWHPLQVIVFAGLAGAAVYG